MYYFVEFISFAWITLNRKSDPEVGLYLNYKRSLMVLLLLPFRVFAASRSWKAERGREREIGANPVSPSEFSVFFSKMVMVLQKALEKYLWITTFQREREDFICLISAL